MVITVFTLGLATSLPAITAANLGCDFEGSPNSNLLKVTAVQKDSPADQAGLIVGDHIERINDVTLTTFSEEENDGYKGSVIELADFINHAQSTDGKLKLSVIRSGEGKKALDVRLSTATGGFGPAYPLGCAKYKKLYELATKDLNERVRKSNDGNFGYCSGLIGMVLLSHDQWERRGGKDGYRSSIDKLKDHSIEYIKTRILKPVEDVNMDGTPNDGSKDDSNPRDQSYKSPGLENWEICTAAMFLSQYKIKTGDKSVNKYIQLAAEQLANRIQDYKQPPHKGKEGPLRTGMMGHGGVTGDYAHVGWTGINIINSHALTALAMCKAAGAKVNDDKFKKCWIQMKSSTLKSDNLEDGNVGYAHYAQGGWDSAGRTAGAVYGREAYGNVNKGDRDVIERQKKYMVNQWQRMQHSHAYTVGGVVLYQFALPYLSDRQQRFLMENLQYFYEYHHGYDDALVYFGGRQNNGGDGYLNYDVVKSINTATTYAVHSGRLSAMPKINPERIHVSFTAPQMTWPHLEARVMKVVGEKTTLKGYVTNFKGTKLTKHNYKAKWSHVSGPAKVRFSSPNTINTQVAFSKPGKYQILLTVARGKYILQEPINVLVKHPGGLKGYVVGYAHYKIYKDIYGQKVKHLTSNENFPNNPSVTTTISKLEGNFSGDQYGETISGYIVPDTTGDYQFYIASDDSSELHIAANTAKLQRVCRVDGHTGRHEWQKNSSQKSNRYRLEAGVPYAYEILHKEFTGGEHVAVAWTGPGIKEPSIITNHNLAIKDPGKFSILSSPESATVSLGEKTTLDVSVTGAGTYLYQWYLDGVSYWPASNQSALVIENVSAGHAGEYVCVITGKDGNLSTAPATLNVKEVGNLRKGGLWCEVYEDMKGRQVSDLKESSKFPRFSDQGKFIESAEIPADTGDNFGQRWTGWITPDLSGEYTFYLAADDTAEMWISHNHQPQKARKVINVKNYTAEKTWTERCASPALTLKAGQRYYVEVRYKEAGGGDHCALAWKKPNEQKPTNGQGVIPAKYLECFVGGVHQAIE